jgi:hypothetical protein
MKPLLTIFLLTVVVSSACSGLPDNQQTPTVEAIISPTPTETLSPSSTPTETSAPSLTPSVTAIIATSPPVMIATVPSVPTIAQPTVPAAPTETPAPYTYIIQANDTLGYILQLQPWGYPPFDPSVIAEVVRLNGLRSADFLPPPGSELLIPRRTPTPIPQGIELTLAADATLGVGTRIGSVALPQGAQPGCHIVQEGQTIVGIADIYNTTLEIISQLNQNLNWTGCRFDQYSGGPNCRPLIRLNDCINVPLPTSTPVPSPTPSGSETPTPTPTFAAPRLIFPPDGAIAPPGVFTIQWASVGVLGPQDAYLLELQDRTDGRSWLQVTRDTSIRLPESMIPRSGQTHLMQWRVTVARADASGAYSYLGGQGDWRSFQWQSR